MRAWLEVSQDLRVLPVVLRGGNEPLVTQLAEVLEQLARLETNRPPAVPPRAPQPQHHLAVGSELQRLLRQRRTQHVATQMLEPQALAGSHRDVGVQIETGAVRVLELVQKWHKGRGKRGSVAIVWEGPGARGTRVALEAVEPAGELALELYVR